MYLQDIGLQINVYMQVGMLDDMPEGELIIQCWWTLPA